MTRNEYLKALASSLNGHISKEEISDILRDYREFFEDGALQNEEEWETAARLGDPREVAAQIVAEAYIGQAQEKPTVKNLFKAQSAVKVYSTVAFIASIPLMLAIAGLALTMFVIFLALVACAVAIFTAVLMTSAALPSSALLVAGIAGAGALFASITILLMIIMMVRRFVKWISSLFASVVTRRKKSEEPEITGEPVDEMEIPPIVPVQKPMPQKTDSEEVSEND